MFQKVLILAPHTDDGELGCGGYIAKLVEQGKDVYYTAFSICENSVRSGFPDDILEQEVKKATKVLGIPPSNLFIHKFEARQFPKVRQEILEILINFRNNMKPDLVLMPCCNDLHQDHRTVAEEGLRAFKGTTILAYEIPWNNINFNTISFVPLEERHIKKKTEALRCYESQAFRGYANEGFVYSLAKTRGTQIERPYAEVFEVVRWIINY